MLLLNIFLVGMCILQDRTFVNWSRMVWSFANQLLYTPVLVFVKMHWLVERVVIPALASERVQQMLVCHRKLFGFAVCEFFAVSWSVTVRQRRLTSICNYCSNFSALGCCVVFQILKICASCTSFCKLILSCIYKKLENNILLNWVDHDLQFEHDVVYLSNYFIIQLYELSSIWAILFGLTV